VVLVSLLVDTFATVQGGRPVDKAIVASGGQGYWRGLSRPRPGREVGELSRALKRFSAWRPLGVAAAVARR